MRFRTFNAMWKAEQRENGNEAKMELSLKTSDPDWADDVTITDWEYHHIDRKLVCQRDGGGEITLPIRCVKDAYGVD